jgi:hypothetical protein
MITVIRNDTNAKFAHDIYGVKIKEEAPIFKLIGTTRNEGICIFESPNYGVVAQTFDIIVDAIVSGEKSILITPPIVDRGMSKEEFDTCDIHDYIKIDEDHPISINHDMYGRKIEDDYQVYEKPQRYEQDFYAWNTNQMTTPPPFSKNSYDNKYLNNQY